MLEGSRGRRRGGVDIEELESCCRSISRIVVVVVVAGRAKGSYQVVPGVSVGVGGGWESGVCESGGGAECCPIRHSRIPRCWLVRASVNAVATA